jgi:ankyrin repeat protein
MTYAFGAHYISGVAYPHTTLGRWNEGVYEVLKDHHVAVQYLGDLGSSLVKLAIRITLIAKNIITLAVSLPTCPFSAEGRRLVPIVFTDLKDSLSITIESLFAEFLAPLITLGAYWEGLSSPLPEDRLPIRYLNEEQNYFFEPDRPLNSDLVCAIRDKDQERIKLLCQLRADINDAFTYYNDAYLGFCREDPELARLLVDLGFDLNRRNFWKDTLLNQAITKEDGEAVSFLIELGANVNQPGLYGRTPLENVLFKKNNQILELLCKNGANLNQPLIYGSPPLFYTFSVWQQTCSIWDLEDANSVFIGLEMMKILIKYGANLNQQVNGETLLSMAVARKDLNAVSFLHQSGANLNSSPPLLIKAIINSGLHGYKMFQHLLKLGVDPNQVDNQNRTVLDLALDKPRILYTQLLLGAGADPYRITGWMNNALLKEIEEKCTRLAIMALSLMRIMPKASKNRPNRNLPADIAGRIVSFLAPASIFKMVEKGLNVDDLLSILSSKILPSNNIYRVLLQHMQMLYARFGYGFYVNQKDELGKTRFEKAVMSQDLSLANLLFSFGADLSAESRSVQIAYHKLKFPGPSLQEFKKNT